MVDAAANLLAGGLVAFPTETVYGLGADACNAEAVARIYSVKGRPADHPLIVHIASIDGLGDWATDVPGYAISLARDFWPGPMTLVVKRSGLAGDFVTGGQDTVGVRVPDHPVALGMLEAFTRAGGKGVAAPSANRFGNVSPTTAAAVVAELSDYLADSDQILDGGACDVGVESTIIDCTGATPRILRPGAVTAQMIAQSTGLHVVGAVDVDAPDGKEEIVRDGHGHQPNDSRHHGSPSHRLQLSGTVPASTLGIIGGLRGSAKHAAASREWKTGARPRPYPGASATYANRDSWVFPTNASASSAPQMIRTPTGWKLGSAAASANTNCRSGAGWNRGMGGGGE
jgi:L-threonylcarbamoyladenylate synthase